MTARTYASPFAFKQALEERLRSPTGTGAALVRARQLLVFERFLARVVQVLGDAVTLKGGLVLELRLERARTTKDIDLRMTGSSEGVLATLQDAARRDLGDFMTFEVARDAEYPEIQGEGMEYQGLRFRAECKLAGKLFGHPFGVDVAFGDPLLDEPDVVIARDVLSFAGIAPPKLRLYPIETHIAEKLHAYTLPRSRPNTRIKDLPDLALLATLDRSLEAKRIRAALEQTFAFRNTHAVPGVVPSPNESWRTPYATLAKSDELPWQTLDDVTRAAKAFLDPILADERDATWSPTEWAWLES
jgi:hypothetical protein